MSATGRGRGWRIGVTAVVLALPAALGVAAATSAASSPTTPAAVGASSATTTTTTKPPTSWRGNDPPCKVRLPAPPGIVAYGTFYTCPPKRVLIIGDSVALTMGMELGIDEQNWGVLLDNQSILGCGFVTGFEVNFDGSFIQQDPQCATALATWQKDVESFKPQVVVVEMGWWDSMQHLVGGRVAQLGQTWYDWAVLDAMVATVRALHLHGSPRVILLTVPWMHPPKFPNGQSQPAASAAFHYKINALLAQAVKETPAISSLFSVSPSITPAGHFELYVGGAQCRRTDGVHLYVGHGLGPVSTPCGRALQRGLLSAIREYLART